MHAYIKESIDQLRKDAIALDPRPPQPSKAAYTPLRDQIIRLVAEMPRELRCRPWSITELVKQLQGRYCRHPHPQMVARELTALGWQRSRVWSTEGRGSRIWHPPINQNRHNNSNAISPNKPKGE